MNRLRIRELVRKEFIQLFRDKKNRPLLIIAPLVQLIVFGYVVTTDVRDIRVALVDQSHTAESRRLIDAIDGNKTFRITHYLNRSADLDRLLLQRQIDLGFIIPPDFSSQIRKRETAEVQILADGSMSNMASIRISYTMVLMDQFNMRLIRELYRKRIDYGEIDARIRTWFNPNLDSQYFYVPGIVAFLVMLLSLLFTSMAIVREKESGTMEQLIVTPLKPFELILGKTIPFIIISQAQMVLVIAFAILWFKIPMVGNAFLLLAATFIFQFLLYSSIFYAERICFPDCQYADSGAMVDLFESAAVLSGDYSRNFSQGHGGEYSLASVFRSGDSGRDRLSAGGESLPKTSGLASKEKIAL
jgi:ABC-2 type transport system permease protein